MSSAETPAPPARPAAEFWRKYFQFYDTLINAIPYQEMLDRHIEVLQPGPGERVLDAGTGTGNLAVRMKASGATLVGTDFCVDALEMCRAKVPDMEVGFADLTESIPYGDASFDKIACINVIYTLPPDGQRVAVREIARVLKPGGVAAITVFGVGFNSLEVYWQTLRRQKQQFGWLSAVRFTVVHSYNTARILYYVRKIRKKEASGDYTFYTPESLTALLEGGGLVVESVEPIFADECLMAVARRPA